MTRLRYRLYRLASGLRYWVPRRFTPAGLLALSAALVSGAIGIDMDQTVAFQAFAFVTCLLAVSMVSAIFFRGRFAVRRVLPRFGSVGQPFIYPVHVRRLAGRCRRDLELLENLADPRPTLADFSNYLRRRSRGSSFRLLITLPPPLNQRAARVRAASVPPLSARGEAEVRVEVVPLRRGPLRFEGVTVARPDPFGLFRGFARVPLPETVLILPRRYPLPDLTLPGIRSYQRGGVALAAAVGESEEFVSLRDYRPGDPVRRVHWRSWARLGRPIVKEFQDEFFVRHALILDTFASGKNKPGQPPRSSRRQEALIKLRVPRSEFRVDQSLLTSAAAGDGGNVVFEEAVSVAASFACAVGTQESLLDLLFVGPQAVCFTTGRGLGQAEQALEVLAAVRPCADKPFCALEELVVRHAGAVCGCVCVLLAWDEPRRELIRKLRERGLPVLVLVVVGAGEADAFRAAHEGEAPEHVHVLEAGRVAEGLAQLRGYSG
jgi:uncharacterized protein (DUF58 family)